MGHLTPHKTVVFDLFHTVVDPMLHAPPGFRRTVEVARVLGLPETEFGTFWKSGLRARDSRRSPTVREEIEQYARGLGRSPTPEQLEAADEIMGRYQDAAILHPREEDLRALSSLRTKGYRLGLLSNADEREFRSWPRSPLAPLFDAVSASCNSGYLKPDPQAYADVLAQLGGVDPARALYVTDGLRDEILGACAVGFAHVVWQRGFVTRNGVHSPADLDTCRESATDVADGLQDLVRLLRELP